MKSHNTPVVALMNNKGGVGKTTLVQHTACMLAEQGLRVVAVDLDPQANLTGVFVDERRLTELWMDDKKSATTIYKSVGPLLRGVGDVRRPKLIEVNPGLALVPGDMELSSCEDQLANAWSKCLDRDERSYRVMRAFWQVGQRAAEDFGADVILFDLGPNLGAINRAALIAADHVLIPLGADLFSLQGLRNLGPTLRAWRSDWADRLERNPFTDLDLPAGRMTPAGYIVLRHRLMNNRPTKAYDYWIAQIPGVFAKAVDGLDATGGDGSRCLGQLKNYCGLMSTAQEVRKPIFALEPGDGVGTVSRDSVVSARVDFDELTTRIRERVGLHGKCAAAV